MVGVGGLDEARNRPAFSSLDGPDQGGETIHVGVVDIDEASGLNECQRVEHPTQMVCEVSIG
jgi:hypothetical protein